MSVCFAVMYYFILPLSNLSCKNIDYFLFKHNYYLHKLA